MLDRHRLLVRRPARSARFVAALTLANNGGQLNPSNDCTYTNDDQSKFFSLTISQGVGAAAQLLDASEKTVAGLGDKAFFSDDGGLDVFAGSTEINVLHLPEADATKVAKAVLANSDHGD